MERIVQTSILNTFTVSWYCDTMSERHTPEESVLLNDQEDLLLAEDIVHALDASVAQSVNRALAVALQPIARQLKR
ncbi:hypothetical protein NDU88_006825 [Pleurodeles waltl]|uniref:Uncharacterized protein n=1 Tax=Pleurodeles waltl TaxID=8319 RepID=A0AAV7SR07_PLEWA|nr:hypothetical protein NDU88_006825 [Pleurodeles waltl]